MLKYQFEITQKLKELQNQIDLKTKQNTSLSPIFIAAGAGIKPGFKTTRVIREVDVAPTVSALLGVPYPAECEGAPVYQILTDQI